MSRNKEKISRRELLEKLSPLGRVSLDATRCTGCGLCAQECSTGSLAIVTDDESGTFQLLFKHGACIACRQCVDICPEHALQVERLLDLDKVDEQTVLFEDVIIRCSQCGSPIGPKTMLDKLRSRMTSAGHALTAQFGLCLKCKTQTQFRHLIGENGRIS